MSVLSQDAYRALLDVSPHSLAAFCGLATQDAPDLSAAFPELKDSDEEKTKWLKQQLGIMQQRPHNQQAKIYHEFAATYLPALAERFKEKDGPSGYWVTMMSVITSTPYFARFSRTPAGAELATLQAARMARAVGADTPPTREPDLIGEMNQFLSTLLLYYGKNAVKPNDRDILEPKMREWMRRYRGKLAGETAERCLGGMGSKTSEEMGQMLSFVRNSLLSSLDECNITSPECDRKMRPDGGKLMQCARCKTAVYCSQEHQKQDWRNHKPLCFSPTF